MLDWIQNKVTVRTNIADSVEILKSISSKDNVFDFNKVCPMPDELGIEYCAAGELGHAIVTNNHDALRTALMTYQHNGHKPHSISEMIQMVTAFTPEIITLGEQYQRNIEQYGFATWYQWSLHHWGTKWNGSSGIATIDELGLRITFFTPWAPPHKVLAELSKQWPDLDIENLFSQPGEEEAPIGGAFYRNGEIIEF